MPGIEFGSGYANNNDIPTTQRCFVGNSLTGNDTSTTPGATYQGDILVLTSNATYATSPLSGQSPVSVRKLTYQDLITNTVDHGILGYSTENFTTDSTGRYSAVPTYGLLTAPIPFAVPNPSSLWQQDTFILKSQLPVVMAGRGNALRGRFSPLYTTAAMGANLNDTQAGFSIITGLNPPVLVQANLTTGTTTGTILRSLTYYLVVTYTNTLGETQQSNVIAITTGSGTDTNIITVVASGVLAAFSGQAALANIAVNYKAYVGTSTTGPFYLQGGLNNSGTNLVISAPPITTSATVPTANTTGSPGVSQYFIDPGAATKFIRLLEVNQSDPLYGTQFATGNLNPGPEVIFTVNLAQCQLDPANTLAAYTT